MATLKDFLATLAVDPLKLGNFIHDPEKAMKEAELSEEDQAALRSGFAMVIHARLSGLSIKEAFEISLHTYPRQYPQLRAWGNRPTVFPVVYYRPEFYSGPSQAPSDPWSEWFQQMPPYYQFPPPYWWGPPPQRPARKSKTRRATKTSRRGRNR